MKLIMNTRAAVAILMATAMIFGSILLEPLQASAAGPDAPGAPTSLTAVGNADSISVSWVAPAIGVLVDRYEISWKTAGPLDDTYPGSRDEPPTYFSYDATTYTYSIPSLSAGSYDVRIKAVAASGCTGEGCYSEPVVVEAVQVGSPIVESTVAPSAPTSLNAVGNADSISVSWAAPTAGGVAVDKYEIGWKRFALLGDPWLGHDVGSMQRSYDIPNLNPGRYDVRIKAVAANCFSDPCYSAEVVTTFAVLVEDPQTVTPDEQTFILTYQYESPAKLAAEDPTWTQVVDSSSVFVEPVSDLYPEGVRGVELVDPLIFWARSTNKYFAGWCTEEGLAGTDMDHCYFPGERFPVYRDTVLYPLWVDDLDPTLITIGSNSFRGSNLRLDRATRTFYLTVDDAAASPLVGVIGSVGIEGRRGVEFNVEGIQVRPLGLDNQLVSDSLGQHSFVPGCTAADCAEIFVLEGRISAGGRNLGEHYTINLIVSSNLTAEFDVSFDATPGALTPLSLERINELENQPVGWYPIPTGEFARTGYSNESTWLDSVTEAENGWDTYFPVLADETLRLDWYSAPSVYAPTSATIYRGDSQVATATSDEYDLPLTWGLIDTEDFSISNSGQITANPQLAVGTYTFFIEAKDRWMTADEPFQMTVTVVERSQVGGSENTNLPPTNQTGAGQHLPKPGSKLQADLISKVSRSKLAVGGTAQFSVTGGEPGATRFFESKNTGICSITARGLVTAKSTGVCLISATATAQDPVFAPASAPLTKIAVLGPGLINNAKVTVLKGQVSIKASLLKSLAGKSVKLAIEVKRGGKWVLVPMRSEVLSKSATATFKSFAKPRPGTRVVLLIGGRAVYALTL